MAAMRSPTQAWTAQQLRNATMEGVAPRFLIRDRDDMFGAEFDRVAQGAGVKVIKTAVRAPNMNPVGERFVGSLGREALDHMLLLTEGPPGQGRARVRKIVALPVLGGLHHDYRRAA